MAKVKITPKMLKQTKLIQKEVQRVTEQNYKAIAKVFIDFGNETEKQFAKITMQDLKWDIGQGASSTKPSAKVSRS